MKNRFDNIILCQPDSKKGCSACCGLLNFNNLSRTSLSRFLNSHEQRRDIIPKNDVFWIKKDKVRDYTSHICPFQGFIGKGKPGCTIHPGVIGKCMRKKSLFGKRVCNDYLCPAHFIMNDEHKQILIKYIDHWYLYMMAIIDPESFTWIIDKLKNDYGMSFSNSGLGKSSGIKKILKSLLKMHAGFLINKKETIFSYAVSEYNQIKGQFSLNSGSKGVKIHREYVIREMERMI